MSNIVSEICIDNYVIYGKQGKDGPEEKKDADGELWGNVEAQAAFLGPNLWDKTLPYDADLKVLNHVCTKTRDTYVDLDEFLSENGIPVDGVAGGGQGTMQSAQLHKINSTEAASHQGPAGLHLEPVTKRERSPSPSECCSPDTLNPPSPADSTLSMASSGRDFDPRTRAFSDEELKPQPMIKKSRKQFVPDDLKDDKYWARRRKNNMAAKRSRDARRMKENQIALRAGFLEKEHQQQQQRQEQKQKKKSSKTSSGSDSSSSSSSSKRAAAAATAANATTAATAAIADDDDDDDKTDGDTDTRELSSIVKITIPACAINRVIINLTEGLNKCRKNFDRLLKSPKTLLDPNYEFLIKPKTSRTCAF
ncbi:hypothetical protein HZH68_008740 [Vespula germanica]|uniref:BZIP domain-containing protein n=1 Tax=Vespula germanica TaxID=30212 RepID=A0A834N7S4_VESGE|nr:hypothetical protein HZH68_008740 [Vespula germanica]